MSAKRQTNVRATEKRLSGYDENDTAALLIIRAKHAMTNAADFVQANIIDDITNDLWYSHLRRIDEQRERIAEKLYRPHILKPDIDEQFSKLLSERDKS